MKAKHINIRESNLYSTVKQKQALYLLSALGKVPYHLLVQRINWWYCPEILSFMYFLQGANQSQSASTHIKL